MERCLKERPKEVVLMPEDFELLADAEQEIPDEWQSEREELIAPGCFRRRALPTADEQ